MQDPAITANCCRGSWGLRALCSFTTTSFTLKRLITSCSCGWLANDCRTQSGLNAPSNYLPLDFESLDRVLFVQVYHDIYWQPRDAAEPMGDAHKVLAILYRALKPDGLIVVLDHAANQTSRDSVTRVANRTHRIDPKVVIEDFAEAGFEFVGESAALRNVGDDHTKSVFDPSVRHRTDQFIYKFRKRAKQAS